MATSLFQINLRRAAVVPSGLVNTSSDDMFADDRRATFDAMALFDAWSRPIRKGPPVAGRANAEEGDPVRYGERTDTAAVIVAGAPYTTLTSIAHRAVRGR